jgi:long-chain acyl-CoA synthetase
MKPWLTHYDQGVPYSLTIDPASLPALLDLAADSFPDSPAISFYGRKLSYHELRVMARRFAGSLLRDGLTRGERVLLMLPNVPQAVICYYGTLLAGGIVVLSNPLTDAEKLSHELADSGASRLVALSMFFEMVEQAKTTRPLHQVIYTNLKEYLPATQRGLFTLLRQSREGHRVPNPIASQASWLQHMLADEPGELPALQPDDDAVILYTSGTTGQSKGVLHSHASLQANALQSSAWFAGAKPGKERVLCAVPFSHSYGMTACMNMSVAMAATMILLPTFETEHVLKAIKRERPTFFPGVPPMYAALNEVREIRSYGFDSLKGCLSGAAPLPIEVQEGFERITRARLVEGYGLSEAGPATHANPIFGDRRSGSIGLPLPNTEARIVDLRSGEDLPAGEIGELLIRGPQLMKGYWGRPDETAEVFTTDGWLHTGDVARMTADGYFQVIERKKEMIIAGPYNIYPRDLEEVLYEHPKVIDAAVVGVAGPDGQPTIKAFVVLREGEQVSEAEVFAFLDERLHLPVMPSSVEFRQALPRSFIGKIMRRHLVEPQETI